MSESAEPKAEPQSTPAAKAEASGTPAKAAEAVKAEANGTPAAEAPKAAVAPVNGTPSSAKSPAAKPAAAAAASSNNNNDDDDDDDSDDDAPLGAVAEEEAKKKAEEARKKEEEAKSQALAEQLAAEERPRTRGKRKSKAKAEQAVAAAVKDDGEAAAALAKGDADADAESVASPPPKKRARKSSTGGGRANKKKKAAGGGGGGNEKKTPPAKKAKKEKKEKEPEKPPEHIHAWWESNDLKSMSIAKLKKGEKWSTQLVHHGPVFPPLYEPHGVRPIGPDGKPMELSVPAEEGATFYSRYLDHPSHSKNDIFKRNFYNDWRELLTDAQRKVVSSYEQFLKVNFRPINEHLAAESEKHKKRPKEVRDKEKADKAAEKEQYGFALIDGRKQMIANYMVEIPGLFLGRGKHPSAGRIKKRITPADITINLSRDAPVPKPPAPYEHVPWKAVVHDNKVGWLALWKDFVTGQHKYMALHASSVIKGMADLHKYQLSRKLALRVDRIRANYMRQLTSGSMEERQTATAVWFIDHLALRAGNEKGEDEAETFGCCSLQVRHITLHDVGTVLNDDDEDDYDALIEAMSKSQSATGGTRKKAGSSADKKKKEEEKKKKAAAAAAVAEGGKAAASSSSSSSSSDDGVPLGAQVEAAVAAAKPRAAPKMAPPGEGRTKPAVTLQFLGKDSIPYKNTVEFDGDAVAVFENLKRFSAGKAPHKPLFDKIDTGTVNAYLKTQMPYLSAKVFRTYNASVTLEQQLAKAEVPKNATWKELVQLYTVANRDVAVLCNHQRATPKSLNDQLEKMEQQCKEHEAEIKYVRALGKHLAAGGTGKAPALPAHLAAKEKYTPPKSAESCEKRAKRLRETIQAKKTDAETKRINANVSTGTSKINYMDPRITLAWCKRVDLEPKRVFAKTLISKFGWALDVDPNFKYVDPSDPELLKDDEPPAESKSKRAPSAGAKKKAASSGGTKKRAASKQGGSAAKKRKKKAGGGSAPAASSSSSSSSSTTSSSSSSSSSTTSSDSSDSSSSSSGSSSSSSSDSSS